MTRCTTARIFRCIEDSVRVLETESAGRISLASNKSKPVSRLIGRNYLNGWERAASAKACIRSLTTIAVQFTSQANLRQGVGRFTHLLCLKDGVCCNRNQFGRYPARALLEPRAAGESMTYTTACTSPWNSTVAGLPIDM